MYLEERNPPKKRPVQGAKRLASFTALGTNPGTREEDFFTQPFNGLWFWAWKIHSARLGSVKGAQQLLQRWDDLEAFGVEELVKLVDLAGQEDGGGKR